jgi:uncharacterized membrane protein YidH (DUF202 family)
MRARTAPPVHVITWRRAAIAVVSAGVVVAGARVAFLLSDQTMNAVALVGAWVMLTLVAGYVVARFRPAVGAALLVGVGIGAAVVALFAGMGMMG